MGNDDFHKFLYGVIIAGHTRYKASKKLGLEEAPCIIADDLTEEQIKAYRLADNKVAEKVKKIVKWIAVIAAAIGAAAAVIMEQGCTHKHVLKANGIKIDTIEVSSSTKIK